MDFDQGTSQVNFLPLFHRKVRKRKKRKTFDRSVEENKWKYENNENKKCGSRPPLCYAQLGDMYACLT